MCVSSPYRQGILYRMLFFFRYRSIDYVESVYLIFRLLDLYTSLLGNLSNTKPVYLVLFSSFFQVLLPSDKPSLVCSRCFQLFSPPSPSSSAPRKDSLSSLRRRRTTFQIQTEGASSNLCTKISLAIHRLLCYSIAYKHAVCKMDLQTAESYDLINSADSRRISL